MAAQGAPGVWAVQSIIRQTAGGRPLRRLQKPCQTALGILPRLNAQARWRILGYPGQYWSHSGQRGRPCDTSVPPELRDGGMGV